MPTNDEHQPDGSSKKPVNRQSSNGKPERKTADGPVDETDDGPATAPDDIGEG